MTLYFVIHRLINPDSVSYNGPWPTREDAEDSAMVHWALSDGQSRRSSVVAVPCVELSAVTQTGERPGVRA